MVAPPSQPVLREYKARIEKKGHPYIRTIEVHFRAGNIIDAAQLTMNYFMPMSIDPEEVVSLIEKDR